MDGVPFLMRDRTLRRTTDVERVFPDRRSDDASSFNWTDLRQLNAGQWFIEVDEILLPLNQLVGLLTILSLFFLDSFSPNHITVQMCR